MMEKISAELLAERCRQVDENLKVIREEIERAAQDAGRDKSEITLLAATKTVPAGVINYAISQGIGVIGENRVQELLEKYDELALQNCQLQMIGHLQTNKVRQVAGKVTMIQSVGSLHLAQEISRVCQKLEKTMPVLIEVNIGAEESKSGTDPAKVTELCAQVAELPNVAVSGLMAIPPICETEAQARRYFSQMHQLFIDIGAKNIDNINMHTLSMGMSADYAAAIREGATMVRIGSSLFGKRTYR